MIMESAQSHTQPVMQRENFTFALGRTCARVNCQRGKGLPESCICWGGPQLNAIPGDLLRDTPKAREAARTGQPPGGLTHSRPPTAGDRSRNADPSERVSTHLERGSEAPDQLISLQADRTEGRVMADVGAQDRGRRYRTLRPTQDRANRAHPERSARLGRLSAVSVAR
jgi:hypothetical protein